MLNILNIFPPYLILLTVILVILPTIFTALLRRSLYRYLVSSANKVSKLLSHERIGKQPQIVENLEARFKQASQKLEQVNTIALIDGLYSQERLNFLGISLRCEQWDFLCQTLPNLLLAFGLLGTFFGISSNLYNLSQTINQSTTNDNLVAQLQIPIQNMGIAFSTSLAAILCSSILIVVNLRYNTNFAKSLLISSLEDYLDNIFKINVQGDTPKLINILENYKNNFQSINSNLSNLASTSEQQGKQVNSNLNGIGMTSDRLLTSFEQHSQNNIKEIHSLIREFKQLINQIDNIPSEINDLIQAIKQHEKQIDSNLNDLGNNITKKANQEIQKLTEQFNKIL